MQTIDIKEVKQEVVDKMEQYKQEFIEFMVESDVLKFGEFTLKSGRKSPFFMNAGAYVTGSQLMRLGEYYAKAIHEKYGDDFDVLFGPAYKGIPISVVTAVAFSKLYGKEVRYCSDRKEEKDHGADKGSFLGSSLKDGDRVVMIEDVTTSGKSMEETVPKVRGAANVEIVGLMVSLNRMEMELGKKILSAKVKNQSVVLRRYEKSKHKTLEEEQQMMSICRNRILTSKKITEMIGFEGQAAKSYFQGLSKCIDEEFKFQGRSRRPPKDEFNSMISFGYSLLLNEVYCKIEMKGLNPYFGFIHRDAEKHPTLASDLMEEWRAVIVDATVMSLINGYEIKKEHFQADLDQPGCYLTREGLKIFLNKLERKFRTEVRYLKYTDSAVSFRRAILLQMDRLAKAIEEGDASIYEPIIIR